MTRKTIVIVIMLLVVTNLGTFLGVSALDIGVQNEAGQITDNNTHDTNNEAVNDDLLSILPDMIDTLENNYFEDLDRGELIEGAVDGMLDVTGDPQTSYLTSHDLENLRIQTEGSYGGIGIEVSVDSDYITVMTPMPDTPGDEVGLKSGDRIIEVDGENVVGKDLDEAITMMRGPAGSDIELKIERPAISETLTFDITREEIQLDTVNSGTKEDRFGYIEITNFAETTDSEFKQAKEQLEEDNIDGLILDLRNNPGGLLDACIDVSQHIVPEGPIVHKIGRDEKLETYKSQGSAPDYPVVVLVNEVSASASEILAGALQDTDTATLVGTNTFGKASVQQVEFLRNQGALRYTMAKYQTPDGRDIHDVGLTPDIEVEQAQEFQWEEYAFDSDASPGDEGEKIENLQSLLKLLGYYDEEVTGSYGETTEQSVKDFQVDEEIEVTGDLNTMVMQKFHERLEELRKEDDRILDEALELLRGKVE